MFIYIPSKIHIPVLQPTCTLTGCFALLKRDVTLFQNNGLFLGGSPSLWQLRHLCVSNWIVHSSVKIILANLLLLCLRAKSSLFCLLASRISWQYVLPLNVHPNDVLHWTMVRRLRAYPMLVSRACSWLAVVSSSRHICSSTILLMSEVITILLWTFSIIDLA